MGGHGGLNILPQKRWNVYNYDNREKVRKDEEAAAREEQLKREQARKRDAEFRLERLRAAKGLAPLNKPAPEEEERAAAAPEEPEEPKPNSESKNNHINLFEGIKIFDPIKVSKSLGRDEIGDQKRNKKVKKEEVRVVTAEDEKYRLGYGVAGKGVKLPWYLERRRGDDAEDNDGLVREENNNKKKKKKKEDEGKKGGKKTLEELRKERLEREKKEKERERALLREKSRRDGGFSRR